MTRHWSEELVKLDACAEAVEWARGYGTLAKAWAVCERADWMLWLTGRCAGPVGDPRRRRLALAVAAAYAADDADDADDARNKALREMAEIVRQFYPEPPVLA